MKPLSNQAELPAMSVQHLAIQPPVQDSAVASILPRAIRRLPSSAAKSSSVSFMAESIGLSANKLKPSRRIPGSSVHSRDDRQPRHLRQPHADDAQVLHHCLLTIIKNCSYKSYTTSYSFLSPYEAQPLPFSGRRLSRRISTRHNRRIMIQRDKRIISRHN